MEQQTHKILLWMTGFLFLRSVLFAEEATPKQRIVQIEQELGGRVGLALVDRSGKERLVYRGEERFPMCSTFKLLAVAAVLKNVDENKETLGRFVPYGEAQLLEYAPVTRAHVNEGGMKLGDLCAASIEQSDNTAGNLILETIGGPSGLTRFARSLGDEFTRLDRTEPELNRALPGDEKDITTAAVMCHDLQQLLTGKVLTVTSRERLETWMQHGETGKAMIRASAPSNWKVGDKTGRSATGATNDIAVLRDGDGAPVFLSIFTYAPAKSTEERDKGVADLARVALESLNQSNG